MKSLDPYVTGIWSCWEGSESDFEQSVELCDRQQTVSLLELQRRYSFVQPRKTRWDRVKKDMKRYTVSDEIIFICCRYFRWL